MDKVVYIGEITLSLTKGKVYDVIYHFKAVPTVNELLTINDDSNKTRRLSKSMFKTLEEYREERINKILNS